VKATLQIGHTNNQSKSAKSRHLWLLLLFFCSVSYAQLPAFDLNVASTDESCPGNGTLTCTVTNTDPGATIVYRVYLLPDTTTPIAVLISTNFLGGLTSGDYRVVATQTLGTDSNTETMDVTIANQIVPLAYTISGTPVTCGNNGTMTVNIFSGTAVSYEIISGPVTAPLQASNVFTGLSVGVYQVRVFDNCGQGWVTTHTLFSSLGTSLTWTESDQAEVVDCNQITIINTLAPELNAALSFPVTITYTIHPPGGGPDIVNTINMASGDISGQEFITVIPYYSNQVYSYNVTVTDACGNEFYFDNILINKPFLAEIRRSPAECGEYFITLAMDNFMPPATVNFLEYPAGFDPVAYNPGHPGPFYNTFIDYGDAMNGVPYGYYKVEVTDGCGRTVITDATLEYIPPIVNIQPTPHEGCDSDVSDVKFKSSGYLFDSAIINSGPAAYSPTYPVDVSANIDPVVGDMTLMNMPAGTYNITITDTCGNTYIQDFIVPGLNTNVSFITRPGCELGKGSVRIRGNMVDLVSAIMMVAPPAFTSTLPYDVTFNISTMFPDTFSMAGLPEGDYEFEVTDSCGQQHTVNVAIIGYAITENTYSLIRHCGSFDLDFHFASNGTSSVFWLQRYDPVTNTWGHPQTGSPYNPGDIPNNTNSLRLQFSDAINYNISYLGDFRIIHRFESFGDGNGDLYAVCADVIQEFTFINELQITSIQKATCNGVNSDVSVTAVGVPPLTYQITSRNGQAFFIDNGNNNVFANLQPAIYNFLVFDSCGNINNTLTDVALLPSLVIINRPGNLVECDGDNNDNEAEFNLVGQNNAVLGSAVPSNFTISYHLSEVEATTGSNPLPLNYTTGSREIFVRMQYNNVPTCFDVTSFNVTVNEYPELDMSLSYAICQGENVTITADAGFDSYLWSTGENTPTITVDEPGIYTLEVTQTLNGITCTATYSVTVVPSEPAIIKHIETTDWTNDQNTITVVLSQPTDIIVQPTSHYSFSLDNVNFQAGNTFYGLQPGVYTVYVKDENGCDSVSQEVYLLAYPKFFTPNDDGYNDFWQIYYASMEPDLKVYVFDRYGKLLTGFGSQSAGWNGQYNGKPLPSTDYWFLVVRQNGTEHRGHFSMKR